MKEAKTALYESFACVAQALASPHRLVILDVLAQGERSVESLAREAGLSVVNASSHLQVLRRSRLVESRRSGTYVLYRLAGDDVLRLLRDLQSVARERLTDVEVALCRYLEHPEEFSPVPADELLERIRTGEAVVIDVRPPEEFAAGHLPGAINVPPDELEHRLPTLPEGRVVAYCRGPYCVYSIRAARWLRQHGVEAEVLEGGLPDWRLQGLPLEGVDEQVVEVVREVLASFHDPFTPPA